MASIVSTRSSLQKRDNQAESYSIANTAQQELGTNAKHELDALLQTTIEIEPLFDLFF